jgi:excinuclease ABC subunit B
LRITRRWLRSYAANSGSFSPTTLWSTSSAITTIISRRHIYRPRTHISRKDSSINDEIDKLRHSATAALFERRDVIIVASVSCIYGLGDPEDYTELMISLRPGMIRDRDEVIRKLVDIQYERNEIDFRGADSE